MSELADEKAKPVARVCSTRCEDKWQEVLICPNGNTYHCTKTEVQTYVNRQDLLDMAHQYSKRQAQVALENVKKEKVKKPKQTKDDNSLYWTDFQRRLLRGDTPPWKSQTRPSRCGCESLVVWRSQLA